MRITVCVACIAQALQSANWANGGGHQYLFNEGSLWIYWVFSVFWLVTGIKALWNGVA